MLRNVRDSIRARIIIALRRDGEISRRQNIRTNRTPRIARAGDSRIDSAAKGC